MGHVIMNEILTYVTLLGLWPRSRKSTKTISYLIILSSSFLFFGSLLYLVVHRKFGSNEIDSIETVTSQFAVLYYMTFFTLKREGTVRIIDQMSDFSKFGKPPLFDQHNKRLNYLLSYFVICLFVAIVGVVALPAIYTGSCHKANEQLNLTKTCGLVAPVWLPFDYNGYPLKFLVFAWEGYFGTMEHLIIRIEQLKLMFPEILNEANRHIREQKLKNWVQYHLALFGIGKLMTATYTYCLSVIVLCVGILFGCIGVSTMQSASSNNSVFLFLGWFQSLIVLSVCGQRLIDTCLSVGIAVYNSRWYDMDVSFQKSVHMILIRSQKPILIYTGPFSYLSHLLILSVLQTAYSYINLLSARG
ncbi:putative odorant receptor 85d isoform X2 [Tribolium castaneum]|uniref:putative odorant receptor 85d isoform X2 n=1 Tax=Tribolium castaneum TaxID=7070 RepID=UPI00077DC93E|nr:PREDICTED: putative odorant receptor 85d isoform X2 [Tribolium castaneum]|eukprot:XP_015838983.1 PREDICTED: putative odorant receptor 85d isoform X2 [Tribolium castaneum]